MKEICTWLRNICNALANIGSSMQAGNQSNWSEDDSTSASYIQNKPYVPSAVIIEGTASDSEFTPTGTTSVADAIVSILKGDIVYLKVQDSGNAIYELVTAFNSETLEIETANLTWSSAAPAPEA